jgi:predicted metal-binding membrane protein
MGQISVIEATLRRDRLVVATGLVLVTVAALGWTLAGVGMSMTSGSGMAMTEAIGSAVMAPMPWSPSHGALVFLMWWVMMAAMMLPSAAPLVLLATALHRRRSRDGRPDLMAGVLTAGYLAVWGAFSLAATLAQWGLEAAGGLASPGAMVAGPAVAGGILLAAGLYQLTPLKQACLQRCRSPVAFLTAHWRPGATGAFRMGLAHGAYCLDCCWFLMTLLFVGGVMNPFWIGAIALYVLAEKLAPHGHGLSRVSGLVLTGWGIVTLARIA